MWDNCNVYAAGTCMSNTKNNKHSGICRLCNKEGILINSHIIPKFIFKWHKKSSATGYLRTNLDPNKREQDGIKMRLLCNNCEALFNEWETNCFPSPE